MKKICYGLVIFFMLFLLIGCDVSDKGKTPNGETPIDSPNKKINDQVNIQETVIVNKNNIKITAKSIKYNVNYIEINLLIENNSDQNITVQTKNLSINDIMLTSLFLESVESREKENKSIHVFVSQLKIAKITTIQKIEFLLKIYNADNGGDLFEGDSFEEKVKLETNDTNYTQEYNTSGKLIWDKNDIKIYVLKLYDEESFWGADLMLYIENNTHENIIVSTDDVSINGFMVVALFYSQVNAYKKAYETITFFESDLKDNDISDITEMEFKLMAFNADNWDDIFETDSIKINFD